MNLKIEKALADGDLNSARACLPGLFALVRSCEELAATVVRLDSRLLAKAGVVAEGPLGEVERGRAALAAVRCRHLSVDGTRVDGAGRDAWDEDTPGVHAPYFVRDVDLAADVAGPFETAAQAQAVADLIASF